MREGAIDAESPERFAAVPQVHRFVVAAGCAGWRDCAAACSRSPVALRLRLWAGRASPTRVVQYSERSSRLSSRLPGSPHRARRIDRMMEQFPCNRRTWSRSFSVVMYSTGDLPSTRPSSRPASRCDERVSISAARFPRHSGQVGLTKDRVALEISRLPVRTPHAFEQQVIQAEGQIESGITVPCALGVEEHAGREARRECSSG